MEHRSTATLALAGAGMAVGYAVGTRVGREQGRRLAQLAGRAGRSAPVVRTAGFVGDKTVAAGRLVGERLWDLVGALLGKREGDEAAEALAVDLAEELAQVINEHAQLVGGRPPAPRSPAPATTPVARHRRALAQASSR